MTQRERQLLRWIEENPMITQQELADKAGITRSSAAVHISNLMKKGHIAGKGYILRTAPYAVVVDTNIPEASIAWLAENSKVPLFADPVSTAKAEKLRPVLGRLHTLKPNRMEAELLSGAAITDIPSAKKAAQLLLDTGLRRVFISMGGDGVLAADHHQALHVPCLPAEMVNTTGCGDAFMAAIAWAYLEGTDLEGTARAGLAASSIAMESPETINPAMSVQAVRERL